MEHLKVLILCTCTLVLYSHHAQAGNELYASTDAGIVGYLQDDALLPGVLLAGTETHNSLKSRSNTGTAWNDRSLGWHE